METEVAIEELSNHPKLSWLVRPCERYKEEYGDCTSIKAKFHQYFIYGESRDCSQWKKDYESCINYRKTKDMESLESIIESEKNRRNERLLGHYRNTVWEKRDSPPEDWNKELPEWFEKEREMSFLALKCKELKEGKISDNSTPSTCTIL
ncbi:UPF0545 protein C22orf39 homolog [Penaeus japonicus]|uniref:UPF0545 protein C22orf39 homolog n=1 Tax=Penaeus japonicus TaxID=27405 RepID=UPI001C70C3BD|nr:UPF0545 protein C22orf39 homolog [Penaeus japonicus]XP_042862444.1 UPF0545 protein C22orf39 homolog [Penaeus japonicus]